MVVAVIFCIMMLAIIANFTIRFFARRSILAQIKSKEFSDPTIKSFGFGVSILVGMKCFVESVNDEDMTLNIRIKKDSLSASSKNNLQIEKGKRVIITTSSPEEGIIVKTKEKNELRKIYNSLK